MKTLTIIFLCGMVAALLWLNNSWQREYTELQAYHQRNATVRIRIINQDLWVMVNDRSVYKFENACMAGRFET